MLMIIKPPSLGRGELVVDRAEDVAKLKLLPV